MKKCKMNKKGQISGDYSDTAFETRDIRNISEVSEKLPSGKYRAKSSIYRKSDDVIMARPGVEIKGESAEKIQTRILDALSRKKPSPYYTDEVTGRAEEGY